MLQTDEADVSPSNLKVQAERRVSAMAREYVRDVAVAAVGCFVGGAGLAFLVALVCYRALLRKKLKESGNQKEEEREIGSVVNHDVRHSEVSGKKRDVCMQANSTRTWDNEPMMSDTRLEGHGGRYQSRGEEDGGHFRCPDCSNKGQRGMRPNVKTWNTRNNTEMEQREDGQKMVRMTTEDERRKPGALQGILSRDVLSRDVPNHGIHSSQPYREAFSERPENLPIYEANRAADGCRANVDRLGASHCESCHRNFRAPQPAPRGGMSDYNVRDAALFNGFPPQHRWVDMGRTYNPFDTRRNTALRRELRNVTFDLDNVEKGRSRAEDKTSRENKAEIQPSRQLKAKLNLNPLRKSKVHPKKKHEQDRKVERSGSKKSADKKQRGRERLEKGGKGSRTKSPEKLKKSFKGRRSADERENVKKKEDEEEEGKHKKTSDENKQSVQDPETSRSGETTGANDQSAPVPTEQAQDTQGGSGTVQNQGTGLVSGSTVALAAAERIPTANLAPGSAGSLLTGGRLSLQGGLSNMASGFKALLPSGPGLSSRVISGLGPAASGALDSFSRPTVVDLVSPASSLLANTVQANPMQTGLIQTAPSSNSQAGSLDLNLAVNPAVNPEPLQLPPDTSLLLDGLKSDPIQVLGRPTRDQLHQLIPDSQAPQITESRPIQVQATDGLSAVTSQALGSVITVENFLVPGDGVPASGVSGDAADTAVLLHQEYLSEEGDSSPRRKLRLALPEKTSSRPPTALERKIR